MSDGENSVPRGRRVRLRGAVVAAVCIGLLSVAAAMRPSTAGHGTHTQLGLPSCSFLSGTGWPCPGCGMTTSMSAMAHGQIARAFDAHPFGVILFVMVLLVATAGLSELFTGKSLLGRIHWRWWMTIVLLAVWLAGWGVKVGVGYLQGDYPLPR